MTEQTKFNVGDRVRYQYKGIVDYGTVIEKDGSIFTTFGDVWALWDNNGLEQNSDPKHLTLIKHKQTSASITEKIQQIEQQLQELKVLLKD